MTVTQFTPNRPLIVVRAYVVGRRGEDVPVQLALDTAAGRTEISPDVADELGYSARDGIDMTTVRGATGDQHGYTLTAPRFTALGYAVDNFKLHVFDLAAGWKIDGLLGLNFLRKFNYEIRSAEGRILAELIAA